MNSFNKFVILYSTIIAGWSAIDIASYTIDAFKLDPFFWFDCFIILVYIFLLSYFLLNSILRGKSN